MYDSTALADRLFTPITHRYLYVLCFEDVQTHTLSAIKNSDHDESLSPTQTNGPETLIIEDIQTYLVGKETELCPKY